MEDRDERGRFAPRNQLGKKENGGNGGRPKRATEETYRDAVAGAITPEDVRDVFVSLLAIAKNKRQPASAVAAARVVLSYTVGLPTETLDVRGEVKTLIEYVNDWRNWDDTATGAPSGPESDPPAGEAVQLAECG